ncbi:trafficking protein particle complex subunit 6b-like [Pristis pectinata]|uniref:trafficking protein particle complex subunit 6b-like n=1 Tax=Pristis pectinata TaxID=685728 RepID=UPI00223D9078|nr:trafficking protein particle complex subunit 6b-like [Pristis pectinata]
MAEVLFELLHLELVARLQNEPEPEPGRGPGEPGHGKCISTLEGMGFRAGQGLIERFTKETPSFKDELDIMKFICKEFWTNLFRKQIDNLRTNHQGTYVLQDNRFRLLTPVSSGKQYLEEAPKFLAFTCGLLRGALSNLGIDSTVTAEVSVMPACKFHVVIQTS